MPHGWIPFPGAGHRIVHCPQNEQEQVVEEPATSGLRAGRDVFTAQQVRQLGCRHEATIAIVSISEPPAGFFVNSALSAVPVSADITPFTEVVQVAEEVREVVEEVVGCCRRAE